jgi:hypothetical protein
MTAQGQVYSHESVFSQNMTALIFSGSALSIHHEFNHFRFPGPKPTENMFFL